MAVHRIKADSNTQYAISASNDTWIFERGVSVFASVSSGIYVDPAYSGSDIQLYGDARGALDGMYVAGASTSILIGQTGGSRGNDNGVAIIGNHGQLVNHGYISGDQENGVRLSGVSAKMSSDGYVTGNTSAILAENGKYAIANNGTLVGQNGITSTNSDLHLTLGSDSFVVATAQAGIAVSASAANTTEIVNHGVIRGVSYAYSGGNGADHLTNTGYMRGSIGLFGGDDVIDLRLGFVSSFIFGGAGNDTFFLSSQKTMVSEAINDGSDTVKSTVSYALEANFENLVLLGSQAIDGIGTATSNRISGNAAANILKGLAGQDIINGAGGNDLLFGGSAGDKFVFAGHFGRDTIRDFVPGVDRIDLSAFADITGYPDLVNHHLTTSGDTLRISHGEDVIALVHTQRTDIHAGDFIF